MELMEPQIQIREKKSWNEGQKEGIKGAVEALRGFGHVDSEIKTAVIKTYGLTEETAEQYL